MKVLLIDDDPLVGAAIITTLKAHHHVVDQVEDGQTGLDMVEMWSYDLILLDVGLPKLDGMEVCRRLRQQGCTFPILMLTAHDTSAEIVRGLDAGADDYLVKPWDEDQLLARIRALTRRGGTVEASQVLTWGDLCLDPRSARVSYGNQLLSLAPKEYALLELFLRHPQRVFSRDMIIDRLWSIDTSPSQKAVTNLVKDLRQRLKAGGMTVDLLETLYSMGYRLRAAPEPQDSLAPSLPQDPQKRDQWIQGKAQFAARFQASLQDRLTTLDQAIQTLKTELIQPDVRHQVQAQVHRLIGSLGAFGYQQGATLAREMEHLLARAAPLSTEDLTQLSQQFTALKASLTPALPTAATALSPHRAIPPSPSGPGILVLDSDPNLIHSLQAASSALPQPAQALQLFSVLTWDALPQWADIPPPHFIVLNLNFVKVPHGLERWQGLRQQYPEAQVLVLADHDGLADRLLASQVGCDRYLVKSLGLAEICRTLTQSLVAAPPLRVMAIDDDEIALANLVNLLQPWGLQVTPVTDPLQFWDYLTAVNPDLLLLDIEMPGLSGLDLCQVVRQDCQYGDIPILVITAHNNPQCMEQVFAAGADDLIHKPILGPELVTRVLSRLERVRLRQQMTQLQGQQTRHWQQWASLDSLTQAANRYALETFSQQAWQQAEQTQQSLAIIFCDIDQFKPYNDHYGHQAGDRCLVQIAQLLSGCVRVRKDQVARYGGDEFVIVIPDTDLGRALLVAERIHQAIAALNLPHATSTHAYVTLSMGIAATVPEPQQSISTLLQIADQKLYAAKAQGGNTYGLSPYP
jgi:diguanylate cyclase (GGDEF)-like protein